MKTDSIIKHHLEKLNQEWYDKKLREFRSAPFYKDDLLEYQEPVIREYDTWDYDEDGVEINHETVCMEHDESKFKFTFNEFAISSKSYYRAINLLAVYGDTDQWLAVADYDPSKQIEDLETAAKLLADRIFNYGRKFITQDLYANFMAEMILTVRKELDKIKNQNIGPFKDSYFTCFKDELEHHFANYLEIEYFIKDNDSLNFNMNLEEISALFAIILKAGFIEDKKRFMQFASKYFKINNPKGNGFVNFLFKNFQDRLNKQIGNKNHRENALGHISELLSESSDRLLASKYSDE